MTPRFSRRACLALPLFITGALPALAAPAAANGDSALRTQFALDALYIPALFLTGSAGKSPDGPEKARKAMGRLLQRWPEMRSALAMLYPQEAAWRTALTQVSTSLSEAQEQVALARWEASHEALEHVREALFQARQRLADDYALDRFTAFHAVMERIDATRSVDRAVLRQQFSTARALWRRIETTDFTAAPFGLSPAQQSQLAQAMAQEGAALSRLSAQLDRGSDADVLQATAAIKAPFIRAYLAFGASA